MLTRILAMNNKKYRDMRIEDWGGLPEYIESGFRYDDDIGWWYWGYNVN